jgi:hypothetical protein
MIITVHRFTFPPSYQIVEKAHQQTQDLLCPFSGIIQSLSRYEYLSPSRLLDSQGDRFSRRRPRSPSNCHLDRELYMQEYLRLRPRYRQTEIDPHASGGAGITCAALGEGREI